MVKGLEKLESRQLLAGDVTLFADSFESGSNSNDWAGNWVEDSQNDYFRSTQRSTDGSRSAEVDGWASNATLTISNPIDLSGYSSAELTFDWLIERGFDSGEYLTLDVSSNGGASWNTSVLQLDGNSDPENQWRSETVDLTPFASTEVLVRFRAKVSRSNEDANVDNVRITGVEAGNQAPVANAGEDQTLSDAGGNGDEFVTLTGIGSDADGEVVSYQWQLGSEVVGTTASITPTLPVGTHELTLTVEDNEGAIATDSVAVTIEEVAIKPVKVFLLAGQSNTTGTASADNLDPFWNVPQDDVWIWLDHNMDGGQWTTVAPGHGWGTHAPRPEEAEGLDARNGLGPELSLARTLADAYPDHRIALIKHGDGGRDLAEHFNPDNVGSPTSSEHMWNGLQKKTDDAIAVLDATGQPYEVEGFFFSLGGGDARNRSSGSSDPAEVEAGRQEALARSSQYGANLTSFIGAARDRYGVNLPFVMSQIAEEYTPDLLEAYPGVELVRQGQLEVAATVPQTEIFSTTGITLRDAVHFDAMGQIEFGTRFANSYLDSVAPQPTIDYPDFSDPSQLNLIVNATAPAGPENALHLTPLVSNQRGAAWHTSKQLVSLGFTTEFDFQTTGNGSDGFAFVVQNDAVESIGGGGGGLGYKNLPNSLAVEFDTFQNGTIDPNNNHVSVQTRGMAPNSNDTADSLGHVTPTFDINDGDVHRVKLVYQPGTLDVFLDDFSVPALSVPVDLATTLNLDGGEAWLGFTGVSGGTAQQQAILNWTHRPLVDPQATIVIDDTQVIERDSGTTELVFTVTRSGDTSGSATVDWNTRNGSAMTGDYVADSGQIVFLAGETEKTIGVTVNGDSDEEAHETLFVDLASPVGVDLAETFAVGTILNDDTTLSISDDTVTESDPGTRYLGEFASATAAQLYQSRGIEFGPDGNVYVSRFDDPAVLQFDGQSGAPLGVFAADPQLAAAKNLEFGPDGNLYVADNINQSIVRFDGTTGAFMDVFVSAGAGGLTTPRGLAFDDNGDLYVSSAGTDQILRFDGATGSFLNDFVSVGSGGLLSPTELTFGDDGHLYVASGAHQTDNSVLRYDGDTGAFLDTFVASGRAGLSIAPTGGVLFGPDVDGDGNRDLWISNGDADEVLVFDGVSGTHLATPVTAGLGALDDPKGLAFDPAGNLLVVDNGNDRILRYGVASQAALSVSLSSPSAIAVVADYDTADGTAMAGQDYIATSGTITFLPGETTKTIVVPTFDDATQEGTEEFQVLLSNVIGASVGDPQATGTILDDGDVGNQSPTADAGADQILSDNDGTGSETVTLTGSGFDSDGSIVGYQWTEGATVLGNTASISPSLGVGTHTLTLTVTDNEGATGSDTLTVTIAEAPQEPLAEFTTLGFLPGATSSDPRGMSADGRYIVGVSGDQAYRWSRDQGMIDLGTFKADDVSHDGSVVVGGDGISNGYRWENGTLSVVGDLTTIGRTEDDPGGTRMSSVHRVSADGSVMVGNTPVINGESDSFRIVGSEIQPLGDLPGGAHNSGARAVSADGSVVVGRGLSVNGDEAYRWENGVFTPLGDLPGGNFSSLAWTVSENGQFVVGQSESAAGLEAYLWSSETGMIGLGHLPGENPDSRARGVSGDGSVVIGKANDDAFIWDSVNGMRNLQSVLTEEYGMGDALAGWRLRRALAISEDGLIITGHGINPSGATESFVVDLDPSSDVGNQAPTADAGANQTLSDNDGTGSEVVTLSGNGSDTDGSIVAYEWSDGATVLGTTATISPLLSVGTHTLTLTVTDNEGATGSDTVVVTIVANQAPTANAGSDQSITDNDDNGSETVMLSGSGSDVDGSLVSYQWTEGATLLDNTASISPSLSIGTHTLTLTVTDNGGASTSDDVVITIVEPANQDPTANAGADQTLSDDDGTGSETFTLTGDGFDADGSVVAYQWTNGATVLGDTVSISPSLTVGTHTLTLTVTDDDGATASDNLVVTVIANQGPTVAAGADQTVTDSDNNGSETVTLTGVASDSDGSIASYQWSDGTTVIGTTASITPTLDVGTHTLTLTVTDNGGAISSDSVTVTIESAPASGPNLSHGNVANVGSSWQTVTLGKSYTSMVVVATPRYNDGSGPGVVRINNVTENSFDVRVDNAGSSSFSGGMHYIAVEEGVYDEPGFKLEAVKYDEAQTSRKGSWGIDTVGYQQSYNSPVVVGQVMTANDPDWSVFWASSGSRTSPPTSTGLNVGKHVAEDPDTNRATETIGYLVIEATQSGTIDGLPFVAGVGGDSVRGVGNGTYQYSYDAMPNAKTAVLSSAGMDGGDGGWAVLRGDNPVPATSGTISLAIDEDQLRDSERKHTTEQVAYFVIDPPVSESSGDETGAWLVVPTAALRPRAESELNYRDEATDLSDQFNSPAKLVSEALSPESGEQRTKTDWIDAALSENEDHWSESVAVEALMDFVKSNAIQGLL